MSGPPSGNGPPSGDLAPGEIRWSPAGRLEARPCVFCGDATAKQEVLEICPLLTPGNRRLLRCSRCTGCFFPDLEPPPYASLPPSDALVQFYVEQGAGIDVMVAPLYALPRELVSSYLEIGCGFGFGVDFAARALGWRARGVDPSPIAQQGRDLLGFHLDDAYSETAPGTLERYDLIYGSEVIEHVRDPLRFVENLLPRLAPGGALLLTTPNVEALTPEAPPGVQYAILSPGYHCVLFSQRAMTLLLQRAGLEVVHAWVRDHTLLVLASRRELSFRPATVVDPADLDRYFRDRLADLPVGTSLGSGMAYRLFKARVNGGKYAESATAIDRLRAEVAVRFGFDITEPSGLDPASAAAEGIEVFATRWPFNLCGSLYFQGLVALNHHHEGERARAFFRAAVRAGSAVAAALWSGRMRDGENDDLREHARRLASETATCG